MDKLQLDQQIGGSAMTSCIVRKSWFYVTDWGICCKRVFWALNQKLKCCGTVAEISNSTRNRYISIFIEMSTPKTTAKKHKKKRPVDTAPLNQGIGKKTNESNVRPLCHEPISEAWEYTERQDAIYCKGQCKTYLHRKCAALSKLVFDQIGESDEPFLCCHCLLLNQKDKINVLKTLVESWNAKILRLTNQTNTVDNPTEDSQISNSESTDHTESRPSVPNTTYLRTPLAQTITTTL